MAARRHQDRHHSPAGLSHPGDPAGGPDLGGRDQARCADDDRGAGARRFHLRRDRQAAAAPEDHRGGCHLRDLHPLGPGLLHAYPDAAGEGDRGFHQVHQLPLPVYRHDHRRQYPGHGPGGADQGLPEDLRAPGGRLRCGGLRGHAGRHPARPRRLSHVLFPGRPDHGRRRRRGGDPALHRLRRHPRPGPGRRVRAGSASRHARQPDGDRAGRHPQCRGQADAASHRRGPPATGPGQTTSPPPRSRTRPWTRRRWARPPSPP